MKSASELSSADGSTGRREIPFSVPDIGEEEIAAVVEALRSGWLSTGPQTLAFEQEFAESFGCEAAIAVSSATAGLHLGLNVSSVGPGDEVLVPTLTFTSTAATVFHVGATPRLVDVEPDTLNISVDDAARKCGPRTKAIVPVHFAGHPCQMDAILKLAAERKLLVMEDAAHAPAAFYRGRRIGTISPLTVFSFYATKNLTTGEGGMITTQDRDLAERLRTRRLHGMTKDSWKRYTADGSWRYDVSYPGFKYNMTDAAAAMGRVQLRRLAAMQASRYRLAQRYRECLQDVEAVELPVCRPDVVHAWHLFVVRVRPEMLTIGRDEVIRLLNAAGIGTSVHFIPLHEHSYYRSALGTDPAELPHASQAAARIISLPLFSRMEIADVDHVAGVLTEIVRRHRR